MQATVLDHLRSNRAIASRVARVQVAVTVASGLLAALVAGWEAGVAAVLGGGSMALGQGAMAMVSLSGGILAPRAAYLRLLLGTLCKWLLVVSVWLAAMPLLGRFPLAGLLGLVAVMMAYPMAVLFAAKVKREH